MTQVTEGTLVLTFDPDWQVIKYDDTEWHRRRFGHHQAMDVLANGAGRYWWIEIKDCEGFEEQNRPRLNPADPQVLTDTRQEFNADGRALELRVSRKKPFIIDEVIGKLRSTLVGVTAARMQNDATLQPYVSACDVGAPLTVVLLLTWDIADFGRLARLLQQKLSSALEPYGVKGFVINEPQRLAGLACHQTRA